MAEFNENLWAPWRMDYIRSLNDEAKDDGCFLCRYWLQPDRDRENHVVWRTGSAFVVLNRFPYTNGHLMVAHAHHKGDPTELGLAELTEMTSAVRDAIAALKATVSPQGFNIGYNVGRCAGAGLPDHLHAHVVPRWNGDTNFMAVLGDKRIIPDSLDALWAELTRAAARLGFRAT